MQAPKWFKSACEFAYQVPKAPITLIAPLAGIAFIIFCVWLGRPSHSQLLPPEPAKFEEHQDAPPTDLNVRVTLFVNSLRADKACYDPRWGYFVHFPAKEPKEGEVRDPWQGWFQINDDRAKFLHLSNDKWVLLDVADNDFHAVASLESTEGLTCASQEIKP